MSSSTKLGAGFFSDGFDLKIIGFSGIRKMLNNRLALMICAGKSTSLAPLQFWT
jgi:hypothetical protein